MHIRRAHFVGIGGVGMSATAKLLRDSGVLVSGSDEEVYPPVSDFLKASGLPYLTPYAAENIPTDADLIVIGKNAKLVPETNPEVRGAYESGKPVRSFPDVLGELSAGKETVVVAGSYGKSTMTALLSHCLEHAGLDPSYFIGAAPLSPAESARLGNGPLFILEGDEYPSSNTDPRSKFLHYHPSHLIVTPLAHDHVNVFPTPEAYLAPFRELIGLVPHEGAVVICTEGPLSSDFLASLKRPHTTYGLSSGTYQAANIAWGERTSFDIVRDGTTLAHVETTLLGEHNVQNIVGTAAFIFERKLMTPAQFATGIASFKGIKRRLDRKSDGTSVPIFEGFGSSYEKARSAIAAMKRHFPGRRLVVVFEPYAIGWRSREALQNYATVFEGAQKVLLLEPSHHAMEVPVEKMAAEVRKSVPSVAVCESADNCLAQLDMQKNDAILLLSSGPMDGLAESIPRMAEGKFPA